MEVKFQYWVQVYVQLIVGSLWLFQHSSNHIHVMISPIVIEQFHVMISPTMIELFSRYDIKQWQLNYVDFPTIFTVSFSIQALGDLWDDSQEVSPPTYVTRDQCQGLIHSLVRFLCQFFASSHIPPPLTRFLPPSLSSTLPSSSQHSLK